MTREEAIKKLKGDITEICATFSNQWEKDEEAISVAISALSENEGEWIPVSERLPNYDECIKRHMSLVLADVQPTDNPRITEITVLKEFEGMTNGEVIQALFPNISVYEHGSTYSVNNEYNFNATWWNAPYKIERGEE